MTAQPIGEHLDRLHTITLDSGSHRSFAEGHCALEVVAWLAGEAHSDHPACVCPVIAAFGRVWNDALDQDDRDRLLRGVLPLMIGTRGSADLRDRRAIRCADWSIRTYTPTWLRLAGLDDHANTLAALEPLTTIGQLNAARRGPVAAAVAAAWAAATPAAAPAVSGAASAAAWAAASAVASAAAAVACDALPPTDTELQDSARLLLVELCAMTEDQVTA